MSGDEAVDFEGFFLATWPRMLRTTLAITRDHALAEDAAQAAYAHAYASWSKVRRAGDPVAYVRRIAVNSALAQQRKAWTRRERTTSELPETRVPDDAVADLLAHDEVWSAVGALPPRQRAVVVLRYYEDLSEQQIADVLGVRPGTVKSQASSALAHLRTHLSEPAPEGEPR